ncbi:MAG TPA: HAMP domain-containing sensor histidine kinase [Ferruginibacter sp.]|nr:HAMP domain-containing sensor histidine kinase [Ferruginibacter sp.]
MPGKAKKIKLIFGIYWILLAYIIAALIWWYIALTRQNEQMAYYKILDLHQQDPQYASQLARIDEEKKRKTAQYIGEGTIFFLLIAAGATFVYRAVSKQLQISLQQQNFMIAITHELKTPIAVAKLNLETLQKRKLDDAQQQKLLQNTLQEANRMNDLCNNMLLSSQIEAGGYRMTNEDINLSELVSNCMHDIETRNPQRMFHSNVQQSLFVTGDAMLLQMAVNNLLDNAVKYSPKDNPVSIELIEQDNTLILKVRDEGAGIADTEKKKIFEKFYRLGNEATKRAKGTGLGLYLTSKIVANHHGQLFVENNLPSGSVFIIQLKQSI